jgi:putative spermidine/putrescine transport system permease protein
MGDKGRLLVLPMVALSLAFFVVPLVVLVAISVTDWPKGTNITLAAYRGFLGDAFNVGVMINTLLLGLKVVGATTLLGVPIGLLYLHSPPGWRRQAIIFLTLLPILTSNVVRTFAWIVILGREGLLNTALLGLGLTNTPVRLLFTEFGLVLALTQIELPLMVLPLIAVLSRLDHRHLEAAATLGAGSWRVLLTVILPAAVPGILAGWVLVFASAATSFVTQAVIGGARNIYLPLFVYQQVGTLFNWPLAAAVAVVLLVSTGSVLIGLALLGRHRRLVAYA